LRRSLPYRRARCCACAFCLRTVWLHFCAFDFCADTPIVLHAGLRGLCLVLTAHFLPRSYGCPTNTDACYRLRVWLRARFHAGSSGCILPDRYLPCLHVFYQPVTATAFLTRHDSRSTFTRSPVLLFNANAYATRAVRICTLPLRRTCAGLWLYLNVHLRIAVHYIARVIG